MNMTHYNSDPRTRFRLLAGALLLLLLGAVATGCIKNDIPYPRIQPNFVEFNAKGLLKSAEIDSAARMITLDFDETVDMHRVDVTSYRLSPGATLVATDLQKPIDLTKYFIATLHLYQDWDWVIQGRQTIERYFTVENQVGHTIIDVTGRRVVVSLSSKRFLKAVKVLTMKLGPEGSTATPNLAGETIDLTKPLEVTVETFGEKKVWTIIGEVTTSTVTTVSADAWTQVAWVYGTAIAGRDNGVEYRIKGAADWTRAPQQWVTHTGGSFCARLVNLNPLTEYEARAYSDKDLGATVQFTTGGVVQVPNTNLDQWNLAGRVWNPWAEGAQPFWDTGNKGAATMGESNTVPTDITSTGTGKAAMLQTKFIGIGMIGKLAAGNIFVGQYLRTEGTNGVLELGRPFTERPTRLRGYLKYNCATISHANAEMSYMKGRPDTCSVWVALIDSPQPFEVRTNPANRHLFDPKGKEVVAYGSFQSGQTIPEYIPFEVELNYVSTSRRPKYILITASASKYGDFFTGGEGSVLYIDDLELLYNY